MAKPDPKSKPRRAPAPVAAGLAVQLDGAKSIADVSALLGPSTEVEVLQLVGPADDAVLVADGVQHATRKISDDAYRVIVRAHGWFNDPQVAEDDKRAVRYAPDNLRVLAWAAAHDAALSEVLRPARNQSANGQGDAEMKSAHAVLARARATREQLADALLAAVGPRSAEAARVNAARRPGIPGAVDVSLAELVGIGRGLIASKDPGVRARVRSRNVDGAWLDACAALANEAAAARKIVEQPGALAVTQTQLDRWDGIVLTLLDGLTRAFNRANAVNVHVPRLAYVALRQRRRSTAENGVTKVPVPH